MKGAIVTGASGGIGAAIATRLASDGFGIVATFAGNATKAEATVDEIETWGGRAIAVQADVANPGDVERVFALAAETFGTIDVLVNCAGIMPLGSIAEGDLEAFDNVIATNLRGTFLVLSQAARRVSPGGC